MAQIWPAELTDRKILP